MKATINGIEFQGTPEELASMYRLMKETQPGMAFPFNPSDGLTINNIGKVPDWLKGDTNKDGLAYTTVTCGVGMKPLKTHANDKCFAAMNGGCYCTGACHK